MIIEPNKPLTKKVEVKTYMTMIYCSHCGAPLKASDTVLTTYPPQYQYNCPKCGLDTITTYEKFPNHVIIKCDDDILFIDIDSFESYINHRINDKDTLLLFPSIINNDVCSIFQKDDGLMPYKYTIACENCSEPGYFTEKLADAILSECLCFYWGCPNLEEYIDGDAFVRLDLDNFEGSMEIVKRAIVEDWWVKRIDIIRREKKKILEEIGFFPRLKKELGV